VRSRAVYLQHSLLTPQMWSGLPKYMRTSAHDSWQVLTFEGKTCSLGRSFTTRASPIFGSAISSTFLPLHYAGPV